MTYEPKTFAKGDDQRVARSIEQEIKLKFDGYKPVESGQDASNAQPAATQSHEGTPDPEASGSPAGVTPDVAQGPTYVASGPTDL